MALPSVYEAAVILHEDAVILAFVIMLSIMYQNPLRGQLNKIIDINIFCDCNSPVFKFLSLFY